VGLIRFGSLRRIAPLDRDFGAGRGKPIDRYYIERFLALQAGSEGYVRGDIQGRILEIGGSNYGPTYAERFAAREESTQIDILDLDPSNRRANLHGDLTKPAGLPAARYDCIICTQVIHIIYDVHLAMRGLHQMLRPGGVLLLSTSGISQICHPDADLWGDFWRFTSLSLRRLAEEVFPPENVTVASYGNVLTASAFLYGASVRDVKQWELDSHDPDYQLTVTLRAVKAFEPTSAVTS
jgi:SAM-dependent methyltransferase